MAIESEFAPIFGAPGLRENAEGRIRVALARLESAANELLRASSHIHNLGTHPSLDDIEEKLDNLHPLITEIRDDIGHLDFDDIFPESDEEVEAAIQSALIGGNTNA